VAEVLVPEAVVLDGSARTRDDAIDEAGRVLVTVGAVEESYVAAMHERETSVSTFMGNGLAIPHGTNEAKSAIRRTAISFVRYAEPIDWKGKPAEFVVGIAGAGDDHLTVLQRLAEVFMDEAEIARLRAATSADDVLAVLGDVQV
jgi:PTS system mannitol-specific IIA component